MTYWVFHLVFILPVIAVLLYLNGKRGPAELPRVGLGFALIAVAAFVYTAPWDNYLVYRGVWSYGLDRISGSLRLGYVPLEEYGFFLLQPLLTGLYLLYFARRWPEEVRGWLEKSPRAWRPRIYGAALAMVVGVGGGVALVRGGHWTYFGLIFTWASPVLAMHWLYGGDHLWRARRLFRASLISATVYLWMVDRIAIEWKIWTISPRFATGWTLLGLPWEEAAFFVVTNLLVIQGLLLFFHYFGSRRVAAWTTRRNTDPEP